MFKLRKFKNLQNLPDVTGVILRCGWCLRQCRREAAQVKIRRRFPSSLRLLICRIDMTALAAILFVLVTAFAVHPVADFSMYGAPKVSHGVAMRGALREDALLVSVTRDGWIYFDHDRVDPEGLTQAVREGLNYGAEHRVYIRADSRARYGTVVKALNGIRGAGVEQVAFLVDGPGGSRQ